LEFYEVICWDKKGRFCRAADDKGLQWFTTIEQAETIAMNVAKDPHRPKDMTRVDIYEAKPIREVKLA
jgi:hypothetical protein